MNDAGHWWLTPIILAPQEVEISGLRFGVSLGKWFMRPISKKPITKKGQGVALSSNPSTAKKKKKKKTMN
jgi:hypothetical protein